jgi:hypothetical protein
MQQQPDAAMGMQPRPQVAEGPTLQQNMASSTQRAPAAPIACIALLQLAITYKLQVIVYWSEARLS